MAPMAPNSNEDIEAILKMQSVAVVGCSPKRERPSYQVASYLMDAGYRVIPVNPLHGEILGEKCYGRLSDVQESVDVVDIFRRPEEVLELTREAVEIKAKAIWMQDGISVPEAAAMARQAGLRVVMDDCLMRQHLSRLGR